MRTWDSEKWREVRNKESLEIYRNRNSELKQEKLCYNRPSSKILYKVRGRATAYN